MENSGLDTWDAPAMRLYSQQVPRSLWGTPYSVVTAPVTAGEISLHALKIEAPDTLGPHGFNHRMRDGAINFKFGTPFQTTIQVQSQTREWACASDGDDIVEPMVAGRQYEVTFDVRNVGLSTWTAGEFMLCERDDHTFGALNCVPTPLDTPPGEVAHVTWRIRAPATPGTYLLRRDMKDWLQGGIGFFDDDEADACVQRTVQIAASTSGDAGVIDAGGAPADGGAPAAGRQRVAATTTSPASPIGLHTRASYADSEPDG